MRSWVCRARFARFGRQLGERFGLDFYGRLGVTVRRAENWSLALICGCLEGVARGNPGSTSALRVSDRAHFSILPVDPGLVRQSLPVDVGAAIGRSNSLMPVR